MVYGAQDIGTWQAVFTILTVACVMTNAGLTVFTMTTFDKYSNIIRFWIYIVFQFVCFGCQVILSEAIPDVPEAVQVQLQRQEFIVSKIIEHVEDDPDFEKFDNTDPVPLCSYPNRNEVAASYFSQLIKRTNHRRRSVARIKPGDAYMTSS
jgi:hypothetical protein